MNPEETHGDSTSITETEYLEFLKTMLAEKLSDDDEIFDSVNRRELEEECLSFGMNLPLVRVIPDAV